MRWLGSSAFARFTLVSPTSDEPSASHFSSADIGVAGAGGLTARLSRDDTCTSASRATVWLVRMSARYGAFGSAGKASIDSQQVAVNTQSALQLHPASASTGENEEAAEQLVDCVITTSSADVGAKLV
ncbi:MAG: hypothetical protein IT381_23605 [Deltaproteobacteria bacterium]|nr:hypothetical protein [Deltaproteobacteria bacterium]